MSMYQSRTVYERIVVSQYLPSRGAMKDPMFIQLMKMLYIIVRQDVILVAIFADFRSITLLRITQCMAI